MIGYEVRQVSRGAIDHLIRRGHYLHRWPGINVMYVGLISGIEAIGAIVFSLPPRETATRYGVTAAWELSRLFILDETPKNTESWFMSRAIKIVSKTRPDVEVLVSYADPSHGHSGVIYGAANWIYDGKTDSDRKTPRFDYAVGNKVYSRRSHVPDGSIITRKPRVSKHRFIYWMKCHEKKRQLAAEGTDILSFGESGE